MTSKAYRQNFSKIEWNLGDWRPRRQGRPNRRSDFACPMVVSDYMPPTQSMADGKIYDSKSAMSAVTRKMGFRELGTDRLPPRERPKIDRQQLKQTIERAAARFERGERAS